MEEGSYKGLWFFKDGSGVGRGGFEEGRFGS